MYAWADGIDVRAGLEQEKAALLVIIGARRDGRKEVLAVVPGYRESTDSWRSVLRELRDRGLSAPKLVVADGAAGVWAAAAEVWPEAAEQRCWNHKIVNVLDQLPRSVQPKARELLSAIPYAATRAEAERRRDAFVKADVQQLTDLTSKPARIKLRRGRSNSELVHPLYGRGWVRRPTAQCDQRRDTRPTPVERRVVPPASISATDRSRPH